MNLRPLLPVAAAAMLVACVDDGGAPEGAQLLVPDRVEVNWDDGFDATGDGVGAMVPVDLMVYEGTTGEPLEAIDLELVTSTDEIELVESESIEVLHSDCTACVWDAMRDRYVGWASPTTRTQTDSDGLARVYVWVDSFPPAEPLYFEVGMGDETAQVEILEEN
ncbi:MAG: hypothetical protein H6737_24890 [Alphaproteobacteria bacterium]|nr:hypothetical protein [Alphaproteobacteria bacterium]